MKKDILRYAARGVHPPTTLQECKDMFDSVPVRIWKGADGGFTIPGKRPGTHIWFFGDSLTFKGFQHSTTIVQTDGLMTPINKEIFPRDQDVQGRNIVYWPGYATYLSNGKLLVSGGAIIPIPGWFENAPMKAAYFNVDERGEVFFERWLNYWPSGMEGGNNALRFGHVVRDPDTNIIHIFTTTAETVNGATMKVVHTSVPESQIETASAWSAQTTIVPAILEGSWSPWIDPVTKNWHSISLTANKEKVLVFTAPAATGPWTYSEYDRPWTPDGTPGENYYVAHAHPWLTILDPATPRTLVCTISHSAQVADPGPHDYRIRFFTVPYPT